MNGFDIILADTRHAANIGAAARVMKNFGFSRLTLVNPTPRAHLEAVRMAVGAEEIIENALIAGTLDEALDPLAHSFAVTRRARRLRKQVMTPEEAARRFGALSGRIGLVFGSEKFGLSNAQVSACGAVISIPASPRHPSLNLAQAVAVVLYETSRGAHGIEKPRGRWAPEPADMAGRKRLYGELRETLTLAGFFGPHGKEKTAAGIEDIFNRAGLTEKDVKTLLGALKSIRRAIMKTGRQPR